MRNSEIEEGWDLILIIEIRQTQNPSLYECEQATLKTNQKNVTKFNILTPKVKLIPKFLKKEEHYGVAVLQGRRVV
jgi:hypothetical protein